jgi:RNA polymerase sigma-70 factor (ECF subfamily)
VSIWHNAGRYAAELSQPQTWLASIVRNRCLDRLRRRDLDRVSLTRDDEEETEIELPADGASPIDLLIAGAEAASVRDCVQALEGGQKQAIALAFFQGLSHAELARALREPLGTVKSWVRRGLARLKQCLEQAGYAR